MKVQHISLKNLMVPELITYLKQYSQKVLENNPDTGGTSSPITEKKALLDAQIARMEAARADDPVSDYTELMRAADARRDTAIIGIRSVADGFTYHYNAAKATAATDLLRAISRHGEIANTGNSKETEKISTLIHEINADAQLNASVATLGIADWLHELEEANNEFNTLALQRVSERAADDTPSVSALRTEVTRAFTALENIISGFAAIYETEGTFDTLVQELNTLTAEYNAIVAARKTRRKNEMKDDVKPL